MALWQTFHKANIGGQKPPLPLEIFMKVKIITDRKPWADGKKWHMGDEADISDADAKILINAGFAEAVGGSEPKRARNSKGQLKKDDPSTPNINEAWEGGKAPKKKKAKK